MPSLCPPVCVGSMSGVLVRRRSHRCFCRNRSVGERCKQLTPVSRLVEDRVHLVTAVAVAIEPPMFELYARLGVALGDKADLNFGLQSGVILPVSRNVPREYKARRRLPQEYPAPVTRTSILTALVPTAPDARLDYRV